MSYELVPCVLASLLLVYRVAQDTNFEGAPVIIIVRLKLMYKEEAKWTALS